MVEYSVLKGRFTKYITRRLEWHAIRYAAHKGKSIVTISLDDILDEPQDERAAEMFRKVEIEVALQQEFLRCGKLSTPTDGNSRSWSRRQANFFGRNILATTL